MVFGLILVAINNLIVETITKVTNLPGKTPDFS